MLKFNMLPNHPRQSLVAYRLDKVSVTPQLPSPQFIMQSWVTAKQSLCRYTLRNLYLYHLARTAFRRRCQKQMHMVRHRFHHINLQVVTHRNPTKDLLQTFRYWTRQGRLPILGHPNEMVLEIINSVFRPFDQTHDSYRNGLIRLRRISSFLPAASCRVSSGGLL